MTPDPDINEQDALHALVTSDGWAFVLAHLEQEWGAQAYAALATVLDTAKRQGDNLFQKLVTLMGQPILHYLQPSIR